MFQNDPANPMMTKRPSSPGSLPLPKRQEFPSCSQEGHHLALPLEERTLNKIIGYIKSRMANTIGSVEYHAIYWRVQGLYEKTRESPKIRLSG